MANFPVSFLRRILAQVCQRMYAVPVTGTEQLKTLSKRGTLLRRQLSQIALRLQMKSHGKLTV